MEDQNTYGEFTEEDILGWLHIISKSKQRKHIAVVGCKTYGLRQVDFLSDWICNDPECNTCSSFGKALQDLIILKGAVIELKEKAIESLNIEFLDVRDKVELKEFDPSNDAYERDQKRLRQRHYRNRKR